MEHPAAHLHPSDDPATALEQLRAWLAADDPATLVITTSGSTGTPKQVLLSRDAVLASAHASARRLSTPSHPRGGRWALVLPSSYVAGVQVIVRSLIAGHDPVLPSATAGEWLFADGAGTADFTSLVPTQLHRIVTGTDATSRAQLEQLASMQAVLVGGGPMQPSIRAAAEAAGVRVVATYGASETAGGCIYDGLPLDGVGLVIGADARVRLGGPTIFSGYLDDPALTAATLVDGWYVTSDLGRLDADGLLKIDGRSDDVVVSGGVNVPLVAVGAALATHPGIAAVEMTHLPSTEWGNEVVAVVVPAGRGEHTEHAVTLAALRDHAAQQVPRAWAPRRLVLVDALPLLANGKIDRSALREIAHSAASPSAARPSAASPSAPARGHVEQEQQ